MGCVLLFADGEELAEGGQGGDGYSDILFEAARMDQWWREEWEGEK